MRLKNVNTMNKMMKKIGLLLALCLTIALMGGCGPDQNNGNSQNTQQGEHIDYAASVKLDMSSPTAKADATVKTFVDGDTTHFNVKTDVMPNGVLKARYIGINTPESTGQIEEWGKKASNFTKETLSKATSIIPFI